MDLARLARADQVGGAWLAQHHNLAAHHGDAVGGGKLRQFREVLVSLARRHAVTANTDEVSRQGFLGCVQQLVHESAFRPDG